MSGKSNLKSWKCVLNWEVKEGVIKIAKKKGTAKNTVPCNVYSVNSIIYRILFPVQVEVQFQN